MAGKGGRLPLLHRGFRGAGRPRSVCRARAPNPRLCSVSATCFRQGDTHRITSNFASPPLEKGVPACTWTNSKEEKASLEYAGPNGASSELQGPAPSPQPGVRRRPVVLRFPGASAPPAAPRGGAPRAPPPGDWASSFALRTHREVGTQGGQEGGGRPERGCPHQAPRPPAAMCPDPSPWAAPDQRWLSAGPLCPAFLSPAPCLPVEGAGGTHTARKVEDRQLTREPGGPHRGRAQRLTLPGAVLGDSSHRARPAARG